MCRVNRVKKAFPWYFSSLSDDAKETEIRLIKGTGATVVRLGYMWTGVNPSPGVFNLTYIQKIERIIARLAAHGIYTLLDMHQDGLSSKFCLYDGVPLWVINKSSSRHAFPWPLTGPCSDRNWETNLLSEAVAKAYQDLYDNHNGMLDDFVRFWEFTAKQFANNPNVLGYELINEPFAGNFYADPRRLLPGVAGNENLQPTYDLLASGIRRHDPNHLIFFEPVTWGMIFGDRVLGSGFDHVPGGPEYRNRSVLSFHYYCSIFVRDYWKHPSMTKLVCDSIAGPLVMRSIREDVRRMGGGVMMTEGMACPVGFGDECESVSELMDQYMYSWCDFGSSQTDVFSPNISELTRWARTYPRAVAGTPINFTFDHTTKAFAFCYLPDLSLQSTTTEIFASRTYSYPVGKSISTTENLKVRKVNEDIISVQALSPEEACIWIDRSQKKKN